MNEKSQAPGGHNQQSRAWAVALAALGVVYGDIGTSPLYALRECFHGPHGIGVSESSVLGVLSLVFWILIFVVSIKYMAFVLRADNQGEGGILALTSLATPIKKPTASFALLGLGIFGAALLYGDGVITPAISVLSAVEGLKLVTPVFSPYVIPITMIILIGLFWFQKHGSARIGSVFGPVMLVWFISLAALGVYGMIEHSEAAVYRALNPYFAWDFVIHHRMEAFYVMSALFLVVTGAESLYADMGHFGKGPIRRAWFSLVLPGLILNYFGQGALLLADPNAAANPFFLLAPNWLLSPLVILATVATVVASQALISGVFSLTRQGIQLGLVPRMQIIHTSSREIGQIYLPQVNWALLLGCLWLVWSFGSSSNLAAAYGISVSATMIITTALMFVVALRVWKWPLWLVIMSSFFFVAIDLIFFSANILKIAQGGYVPVLIAVSLYIAMITWRRGRQILADRLRASVVRLQDFLRTVHMGHLARVPGVAIFMVGDAETTPPALVHNVKHNKVLHDLVIILTVTTRDTPTVANEDRVKIEQIEHDVFRVKARYGFTETPDVMEIIQLLKDGGMRIEVEQITFFLGRETLIASPNPGMAIWREHLFSFMSRNAQRATAFFNIPADQVIEVGIQVEL